MSPDVLEQALRETHSATVASAAEQNYLARLIATEDFEQIAESNPRRLLRLGFAFETQLVKEYIRHVEEETPERRKTATETARSAFACWRALTRLAAGRSQDADPTSRATRYIEEESDLGSQFSPLELWFHLAVMGTLADAPSETRLELAEFRVPNPPESVQNSWQDRVLWDILIAVILLTRKAGGWDDIEWALTLIEGLRGLQATRESSSLEAFPEGVDRVSAALSIVGLYNLAQIVVSTGQYLKNGDQSYTSVTTKMDRHHDSSRLALVQSGSAYLANLGDLVWLCCRASVQNSIWTHTMSLGSGLRAFARYLANKPFGNIVELWPGQQLALRKNILDPYRLAVVVQMPTSAGKTLLAKFAVVQTKALNPQGKVAYLVPTRALVNQVTVDLRSDFASLGIQVEQAVPAFEIDPTENRLLGGVTDVLVTTPEKFDLLLRKDHPVTRDLALVVVDEAHNLNEGERGARLEFLLATIKRDRPGTRFLLLSPFIPNADELVEWIGDGRGLPPVFVDWRPSKQIVGALRVTRRREGSKLLFETLASAATPDVRPGVRIPVGKAIIGMDRSQEGISVSAAINFRNKGGVLVLCKGPSTSVDRAVKCAEQLPASPTDPDVEAVCAYIRAEMGREIPLLDCLRKGVAYHHAGLSQEVRWLIESMIADRKVSIVFGTTTLAQGVNFPISTVLVETLEKGFHKPLSYQDFWNVAGRAGRTLIDHTGLVAFPVRTDERVSEIAGFLQGEADQIVSQLSKVLLQANEVELAFNTAELWAWPELSPFLQYLAHAMRVARSTNLADEVEDLLRSSLIYRQAQRQGSVFSERLVAVCRRYLAELSGRRGILGLADQTGFSTPSVLRMLSDVGQQPILHDEAEWVPSRLFSLPGDALTAGISAIAELPEIRLGTGYGGEFSAPRVASILRDWVNGESLDAIAQRYFQIRGEDPETALEKAGKYLFGRLISQASWGLGALQAACLPTADQQGAPGAAFVPAMVYFGVNDPEAVWFRMAGVPRLFASGLASEWAGAGRGQPESYSQIRDWVASLSARQWGSLLPREIGLSPEQCVRVWHRLSGHQAVARVRIQESGTPS